MSDYLRTGNTPSLSVVQYGNNYVPQILTVYSATVTPSQDMALLMQIAPGETVPTQYGNGFSLGSGGPIIATAPVATLDTNYLPTNPPIGSLCLDSTMGINLGVNGTSDVWVKTGNNATNWAPCSQAYFCLGYVASAGTILSSGTVTFIDFPAPVDRYNTRWGSNYGAKNVGVGNKTTYTSGFNVTVPFSSYYNLWFSLGLQPPASNATYNLYTSIYVNGAEVTRGFSNNLLQTTTGTKVSQVTTCKYLNKGDIISFAAYQDSGSNKLQGDSTYVSFGMVNLGG